MPNALLKLASERQATLQRKNTRKKGNETSEETETRLQRVRDRQAAENCEETEGYSRHGPTSTQS